MRKIKQIFLVFSLVLLAGFSAVLFSGEVSAQGTCYDYQSCIDTTFNSPGTLGDVAEIEYCFCTAYYFNDCDMDYEESDEVFCNDMRSYIVSSCDNSFVNADKNECHLLSEDPPAGGGDSCEAPGPGDDISYGEEGWFINQGDVLKECCYDRDDCRRTICPNCVDSPDPKQACLDYMDHKSKIALGGTIGVSVSREQVKIIQESVNSTCSSNIAIDCKLGYNTLIAISDCNYCESIGLQDGEGPAGGPEQWQVANRDEPLCYETCDGSYDENNKCTDEIRIFDNGCCICAEPTRTNGDECVVEETGCIDGTVDGGKCDVEITDGDGNPKTVNDIKIVDSDGGGGDTGDSCSTSATEKLVDGQSCCEGYKKEREGRDGYVCKKCGTPGVCCGIELNTVVPFIGDCIEFKTSSSDPNTTVVGPTTAFPKLMQGLSKLMVTAILVFSFVLLIVAGVMMTAGGADESSYSKGKQLIGKVIVGIALLGASGVILKLINPNFFG